MAAYLESSNPANVPLYEQHGFVVLGTIQVGSSPSIISDAPGGSLKRAVRLRWRRSGLQVHHVGPVVERNDSFYGAPTDAGLSSIGVQVLTQTQHRLSA